MSRPIDKWELGGEYDKALIINDKKLVFINFILYKGFQ